MSPSKQERIFDLRYAQELLSIAKGDLATAQALLNVPAIRMENALYLVQQSIEKSLKSVLVALQLPVPLVHDLGILVSKIPQNVEPPYGYELQQLTEFATVRRYEEGEIKFDQNDLKSALHIAQEMLEWAEKCQDSTLKSKQDSKS